MAGMLARPRRWECDPYEVAAALRLADALGLTHAVASLLVRRGHDTPAAARRFLEARERHDPLTLPGAREACRAILRHVEARSPIVVYGDYDVDGVCSTAIVL